MYLIRQISNEISPILLHLLNREFNIYLYFIKEFFLIY